MAIGSLSRKKRSLPGQCLLFDDLPADPQDSPCQEDVVVELVVTDGITVGVAATDENHAPCRPADRPARMRMFREARFPALTNVRAHNLQKLLETLEVCSGREGCHPRKEVIASKCRWSLEKVRATAVDGERQGVLRRVARTDGCGQRSNEYAILWCGLARLQAAQVLRAPPELLKAPAETPDAPAELQQAFIGPLPSPTCNAQPMSIRKGGHTAQMSAAGDGVIWGGRISPEDLQDIESLAVLYSTALEQHALDHDPASFARFAAWAHHCSTAGGITDPVAMFTAGFRPGWRDKNGNAWHEKLRPDDRQWAGKQLARRIDPSKVAMLQQAVDAAVRRSPQARQRIIGAIPIGSQLAHVLRPTGGQSE